MRGVGGGVGGPPLRDHLWQGPPLPVTLRLIHPPPKMTQGGNDPLTPLHRLSTASLSGVVRAFAYHRYFRFFLSLFFSTRPNEFFQIQAYLITDFDCWLCYFHYSARCRGNCNERRPDNHIHLEPQPRFLRDGHCALRPSDTQSRGYGPRSSQVRVIAEKKGGPWALGRGRGRAHVPDSFQLSRLLRTRCERPCGR